MKNIIPVLSLLLIPYLGFSQSFIDKIDKGKVITIHVEPVGDAWTNPEEIHEIKIYKKDNSYFIELFQNGQTEKKEIIRKELLRVCDFIESWKKNKSAQALSYNRVMIKAGGKRTRFISSKKSDKELIEQFFKK